MPNKLIILTDIEGTTSSVHFVHEVLFPYARLHLPDFVRTNAQAPTVKKQLEAVAIETKTPADNLDQLIQVLLGWIDEDRKATALKAIQGMIWEHAYHSGQFKSHVYPDAYEALTGWANLKKIPLYVYSSGSIAAQKLYFQHTEFGDLTPLFRGYFDTTMGNKREQASYQAISTQIGASPKTIIFLSDIAAELDAAHQAGLGTRWIQREPTQIESQYPHSVVHSFAELDF
jgi:enolase-phosphatase E1